MTKPIWILLAIFVVFLAGCSTVKVPSAMTAEELMRTLNNPAISCEDKLRECKRYLIINHYREWKNNER